MNQRARDLLTGSIGMSSFLNHYGFYCVKEIQQNTIDSFALNKISMRNQKQIKACFGLNKIDSLQKELKALEATANAQKKEIETLELMEMCYAKERNKILEELSAAASTPWYKKQINQYEEED